ncbi:histone deacetylase domain-containing protein [Peziza echinospora]|nr:histone deacetylase domain-containing protein [Peziza echinospora]
MANHFNNNQQYQHQHNSVVNNSNSNSSNSHSHSNTHQHPHPHPHPHPPQTASSASSSAYSPRTHLPTHPSSSDSQYLHDSLSRLQINSNNIPQQQHDLRRQRSFQSQSVTNSRRGSIALEGLGGGGATSGGQQSSTQSPRTLSRSPSTPTIRKRASMHTLGSTPPGGGIAAGTTAGGAGRLSRKSSLLGLSSRTTPPPPGNGSGAGGASGGNGNGGAVQVEKPRPFTPQQPALTAVILHDSTYKHRFVRPGAKKAEIATVVERPERIPAAVMGICAAQTRIGAHKMSIHKTRRMGSLLDPEVLLVHGGEGGDTAAWPKELAGLCNSVVERHKRRECEVPNHLHQGDLYLCPESKEALEGCIGACYEAVDAVFGTGLSDGVGREIQDAPTRRAFVAIRPPGHHCAETTPSGFCWLNNVHIAIAHAARAHNLTHAVILDIDLHHGDGSQAIAWTLNDVLANSSPKKPPTSPIPQIAYLSLHDINSYPCESGDMEKIRNASVNLESHNQFIQNIHLQSYSTVQEFWDLYERHYSTMLAKARHFLVTSMENFRMSKAGKAGKEPRAAVFLSAGFDASEHESAGMQRHKVHVPTGFYARFAREAVMMAEDADTGCGGRVVSVLEGGYSNRALTSGVLAHLIGLSYETPARAMVRHHQQYQYNQYRQGSISEEYATLPQTPPEYESLNATPRDYLDGQGEGYPVDYYDPAWWDIEHLVELENKQAKRPKKVPTAPGTNYLSATMASAAKVELKSAKTALTPGGKLGPPAPPVVLDWATATVELSKKLIPQVDEEAEGALAPQSPTSSVASSRSSKRHSVGGDQVAENMSRMTLRERKTKPPAVETRSSTSMANKRKPSQGVASPGSPEPGALPGKRVPTMQQIPSHPPSPHTGGRRAVSMGMPPPQHAPARTSTSNRPLEKVGSVGNIRAEASKAATPSPPSSATFSPPQPLASQQQQAGRGLRRVSSTSGMNAKAASAKVKSVASTGKRISSPPASQDDSSIEQLLVNGMKKIRITYKAGEEARDAAMSAEERVRELERLAEEKEKEIERLKAEAVAAKVAAAASAAGGARGGAYKQQHHPQAQPQQQSAPQPKPTVSGGGGSGVSAVRLAAMKLEGQASTTSSPTQASPPQFPPVQPQQQQQQPTSAQPAQSKPPVAGMPPPPQPHPSTQQQSRSGNQQKSQNPPQPPRTATNPPPQQQKKQTPQITTVATTTTNIIAPSPTSSTPVNAAPPTPVIVTIPPTRPTTSWDEYPESGNQGYDGGYNNNNNNSHANQQQYYNQQQQQQPQQQDYSTSNKPQQQTHLQAPYQYSDDEEEEDVEEVRAREIIMSRTRGREGPGEGDGDVKQGVNMGSSGGSSTQSPPPPYNSVVAVGTTVGGVGQQGGQGQQGFGFNVMKPLTVGLGGGSAGGGGGGHGGSGSGGGQ